MRTGGYSDVAAALSQHYGQEIGRQQVYQWNVRRTVNAAGQMFPSPATENPDVPRTRPRLEFDIDQVIRWTAAGVPGINGSGWRHLGNTHAA